MSSRSCRSGLARLAVRERPGSHLLCHCWIRRRQRVKKKKKKAPLSSSRCHQPRGASLTLVSSLRGWQGFAPSRPRVWTRLWISAESTGLCWCSDKAWACQRCFLFVCVISNTVLDLCQGKYKWRNIRDNISSVCAESLLTACLFGSTGWRGSGNITLCSVFLWKCWRFLSG